MDHEPPRITRVAIDNYRSIARCDVPLGPLTILVGRNGAGKSNFLDALRFIADALRTGLDAAVRARGTGDDLRYRGAGPGEPIGLHLDLALPNGATGRYLLRLAQRPFGGFAIAEERCTVDYPATERAPTGFHIRDGKLSRNGDGALEMPTDRLHLAATMSPHVRPVYDLLANMAFYQPIPVHMRSPQPHDAGDLLLPDGSNVASVVLRMEKQHPEALQRITEYLHAVLPTLLAVRALPIAGYNALQFYQQNDDDPLRFYHQNGSTPPERPFIAASMSDGTLHMLGVLVALFQGGFGQDGRPTLIGIEEPEAALHPASAAVLRDAFADVAEVAQVIVTTQSADLLDDRAVPGDWILAVEHRNGSTRIGPLGAGQQSILQDRLATAGEVLRTSDFRPALAEQPGRTR